MALSSLIFQSLVLRSSFFLIDFFPYLTLVNLLFGSFCCQIMSKLSKLLFCWSFRCCRKRTTGVDDTATNYAHLTKSDASDDNKIKNKVTDICSSSSENKNKDKVRNEIKSINDNLKTNKVTINNGCDKLTLQLPKGNFTCTYILSQFADSGDIANCKNCYLSYNGLALAPHDNISVPFNGDVVLFWKLYGGAHGLGRKKEGRKFYPSRDCITCVHCGRDPPDGRFTHPQSWEEKQQFFLPQLSLKPTDCLCRKCNTALLKQINSAVVLLIVANSPLTMKKVTAGSAFMPVRVEEPVS